MSYMSMTIYNIYSFLFIIVLRPLDSLVADTALNNNLTNYCLKCLHHNLFAYIVCLYWLEQSSEMTRTNWRFM